METLDEARTEILDSIARHGWRAERIDDGVIDVFVPRTAAGANGERRNAVAFDAESDRWRAIGPDADEIGAAIGTTISEEFQPAFDALRRTGARTNPAVAMAAQLALGSGFGIMAIAAIDKQGIAEGVGVALAALGLGLSAIGGARIDGAR